MKDEEAFALDEYYTKNPPKVDPSKARVRIPLDRLKNASLLKLLQFSEKSIQEGKVYDNDEVFLELRNKINNRKPNRV